MGNLKVWKDSHSMLRNPQSNTWSVECGVLSIHNKFGACLGGVCIGFFYKNSEIHKGT